MSYSPDSFVADEVPTTAKWNKLWNNDASFNDGTGIADDKILARHILEENVLPYHLEADLAAITSWAWQTYTPSNSGITLGNGTQTAKYCQIGKTCLVRYHLIFGSTTAITGDIQIGLPVTAASYPGTAALPPLGNSRAYDVSGGAVYDGSANWISTTKACLRNFNASGTYAVQTVNSSTVPFTWAVTDELHAQLAFEVA